MRYVKFGMAAIFVIMAMVLAGCTGTGQIGTGNETGTGSGTSPIATPAGNLGLGETDKDLTATPELGDNPGDLTSTPELSTGVPDAALTTTPERGATPSATDMMATPSAGSDMGTPAVGEAGSMTGRYEVAVWMSGETGDSPMARVYLWRPGAGSSSGATGTTTDTTGSGSDMSTPTSGTDMGTPSAGSDMGTPATGTGSETGVGASGTMTDTGVTGTGAPAAGDSLSASDWRTNPFMNVFGFLDDEGFTPSNTANGRTGANDDVRLVGDYQGCTYDFMFSMLGGGNNDQYNSLQEWVQADLADIGADNTDVRYFTLDASNAGDTSLNAGQGEAAGAATSGTDVPSGIATVAATSTGGDAGEAAGSATSGTDVPSGIATVAAGGNITGTPETGSAAGATGAGVGSSDSTLNSAKGMVATLSFSGNNSDCDASDMQAFVDYLIGEANFTESAATGS